MGHHRGGFILLEIMVSLVIITICIVSFMRFQVKGMTVQIHALNVMALIDSIEEALDRYTESSTGNVFICNNRAKVSVFPISSPVIHAAPPNFSYKNINRMKVISISVAYNRDLPETLYYMPAVKYG